MPSVSGFTLVRNATLLDFPLEASVRSLLPVVDELVVNVGRSDDDTRDRVRAIDGGKVRIIDAEWDLSLGAPMLARETDRAMAACRHRWGIYLQADEVLADGNAVRLRDMIEQVDADRGVDGLTVEFVHFYGGFDTVVRNRKWYPREVRAVRLDADIHSYRDAQGFRRGADDRRLRAVASGGTVMHYGWARPAAAIAAKRAEDARIEPKRTAALSRPLLPWMPGITPFTARHPAGMEAWVAARRGEQPAIAPFRFQPEFIRFAVSSAIERMTGWRPFAFRNYTLLHRQRRTNSRPANSSSSRRS